MKERRKWVEVSVKISSTFFRNYFERLNKIYFKFKFSYHPRDYASQNHNGLFESLKVHSHMAFYAVEYALGLAIYLTTKIFFFTI